MVQMCLICSLIKKKFIQIGSAISSLSENDNSLNNPSTTTSRASVIVNTNSSAVLDNSNSNTAAPRVNTNTNTQSLQGTSHRGRIKKTRGGRASTGSSQSKNRTVRKGAKTAGRFRSTGNYSSTGISAAQGIVVGEPMTNELASAQTSTAHSASQSEDNSLRATQEQRAPQALAQSQGFFGRGKCFFLNCAILRINYFVLCQKLSYLDKQFYISNSV